MEKIYKKVRVLQWFTLVELIIVITILAILATITFISFQNFSKDARDAVRVSTLKNIETWLSLYQIKNAQYPTPKDWYIYIKTNWKVLWKQWFIDSNIAESISLNKENKDILYLIWEEESYFQIWTFLENHIFYSLWDNLWIILDKNWNQPNISPFDISQWSHLNDFYNIFFSEDEVLSGTWKDIFKILENWLNLAYWLKGYWTFDDDIWSKSTAAYLSSSDIKQTSFQDPDKYFIVPWKKWNALYFTWASQTWLTLPLNLDYQDFSKWTTLSFYTKIFPEKYNWAWDAYISIWSLWMHLYSANVAENTHIRFIPYKLHEINLQTLEDDNPFVSFLRFPIDMSWKTPDLYEDGNYHLHTISFNDWGKFRYYIDNNLIYTNDSKISNFWQQFLFTNSLASEDAREKINQYKIIDGVPSYWIYPVNTQAYKQKTAYFPNNVEIWKRWFWEIDEVRIYNRMLDDKEILQLYNNLNDE